MGELEDGDEIEIEFVDEHIQDCADYFATVLTEAFPEVDLVRLEPNEWRQGWTIMVPHQFTDTVANVAEKAKAIRDELWWKHAVLVPYVIERPAD